MRIGGGFLSLGEEDSLRVMSAEVTSISLVPETEETIFHKANGKPYVVDQMTVWYLEGEAFQSFDLAKYAMRYAGQEVPFRFTPDVSTGKILSGICVVAPVLVGGDVGTRARTEFSFRVVGNPPSLKDIM